MTRRLRPKAVFVLFWAFTAACSGLLAQKPAQAPAAPPAAQEQEPPEEDESLKPKEYSFNPIQAAREMKIGEFYFKKHNYRAAARRFSEATKWDPTSADAFLRLGEAQEKLKDPKSARIAYAKYVELAPDGKEAEAVRRKLAQK